MSFDAPGEAVSPSEQDLTVVNAREDKARRARFVAVQALAIGVAMALLFQRVVVGLPGVLVSLGIIAVGYLLAWRGGFMARAHAMFELGAIRRDGLAATARLNRGDIEGARRAYAALLRKARPLGAFHAVHVLMYGVTCFIEGDAKEGRRLASRALESGWLDDRPTREIRDAAETWLILMLLDAGEVAEARRRVEASSGAPLVTASIMVCAWEERWDEVVRQAQGALGDPGLARTGRPTLAALGLLAAKKLGRADAAETLAKVLDAEPLGPLARKNPALVRLLGA